MNLPTSRGLPLLLLGSALAAQNLIGLTLNSPRIIETSHSTCTLLSNCGPIGPFPIPPVTPPTSTYWPGGAAWDAANNGVWVTTGSALALMTPGTCTLTCGPINCPRSPGSLTTGLDRHDTTNEIWGIDDGGWITTFTASSSCATTIQNAWNTGLVVAGNLATTGITIDELRGLVFYSTADFGAGSGSIYVAPIATPGAWFQVTPVQDCFTTPSLVTGLAADASNAVLYWTNGRGTFAWGYTYNPSGPSVTFTPGTCCLQVAPFPDPYIDLAIRWAAPTPTGGPCANGSCQPCPMVHTLRTVPLLGSVLQLGLDQAEPNTLTLCAIGFGPCNAAGPVIAPFCGPLMVSLPVPVVLGPGIPVGPGPCGASHTEFLPLPNGPPALVGTVLSSQFVSLCAPSGTAMSNCLSWVLQ
jgi:hypothetical protein